MPATETSPVPAALTCPRLSCRPPRRGLPPERPYQVAQMAQPFGVHNHRQAFGVHGPEHIGGISPDHARRAIWQRHHEIQRPAAPAEPARLQPLPEQRMRPRGDLDLARQDRTKLLQSVAFVLAEYEAHYNTARPHQGIAQRVPDDEPDAPRATVTDIDTQQIRRKPVLGGLINEYTHAA